ncbi:MAG: DUF502 domain-containing protein [Azoarcus sp.]|jgi:uncharacterized membrane protein|nr:DUF502 domain-containing protein [Azoarcus sp.]
MKRYFITGLLIWIPLSITGAVLAWIVNTLDGWVMPWLPQHIQPQTILGFNIPGLGVVLCALILFATGVIGANVLGQRIVRFWESMLARIPVVKSLYYSIKQVSDTLFSDSGKAFSKALLVQYPREGIWTIAFLTGTPSQDIAQQLAGDYISVYVPTTPNPTSGFFLMLPLADVIELDMSVDEALKYIISMGVVAPPSRSPETSLLILD